MDQIAQSGSPLCNALSKGRWRSIVRHRIGKRLSKRLRLFLIAAFCLAGVGWLSGPASAQAVSNPGWYKPEETTPGVRFGLQERKRLKVGDPGKQSEVVDTRFFASGYPRDKTYELWSVSLDKKAQRLATLRADASGTLRMVDIVTGDLKGTLADIRMTFGEYAKAEPFNFALISVDKKVKAFAKFFPDPLEGRQGKCRVWLERVSSDAFMFVALGTGFAPGEQIRTASQLGEEVVPSTTKIAADGTFGPHIIVTGNSAEKQRASYTVKARSCTVRLDYVWGPQGFE